MILSFISRLLAITLALSAVPGIANNTPPVHFPDCAERNVEYFSYTEDRHYALEICKTPIGHRFTYGLLDSEEGMVRFSLYRDAITPIQWEGEEGILIRNYAILTNHEGQTRLRVNEPLEPLGHWLETILLDEGWWGFVNHLYTPNNITPCAH